MGHSRIHRIKIAIQAIHVNQGSPWCIHLWICLLALCQLDARMHAWMDGWLDWCSRWMDPCKHFSYMVRHFGISSSSFRWRVCCWKRHWLKSSASCGHLSSVVNRTGADVQTNHTWGGRNESQRLALSWQVQMSWPTWISTYLRTKNLYLARHVNLICMPYSLS